MILNCGDLVPRGGLDFLTLPPCECSILLQGTVGTSHGF